MSAHIRQKGSALIMVTVMSIVLGLMMVALYESMISRSKVETYGDETTIRFYATEAGLSRARYMVTRHSNEATGENWLKYWSGTAPDSPFPPNAPDAMRPVVWEDGRDYFIIGDPTTAVTNVQIFVIDTNPAAIDTFRNWYFVVARAETNGETVALAQTMRPRDLFSRYARFVSNNELSIGDNAAYTGEVHCNRDINLGGKNIRFMEDTTCSGIFKGTYYDSSNTRGAPYTKFYKNFLPGVSQITLPEASDIEAIGDNPPPNAVLYDAKNAEFKSLCASKTGYTPTDSDRVDVTLTFKKTKMDTNVKVYNSSGSLKASYNTADENIPHNSTIFTRGNVFCKGDLAARLTLYATKQATVSGPLRYVNEAGEGQYAVYKNGAKTNFDTGKREWTDTASWASTGYEYKQDPAWVKPSAGGAPFNPCLGIVAVNDIFIGMDTADNNTEVHAYLFSCSNVVRPKAGLDTTNKNLYVLGGLITTGTNPLSGNWAYRHYVYDRNLMTNPPPDFPTAPVPAFRNWHVVGSERNSDGTFRLSQSRLKELFF